MKKVVKFGGSSLADAEQFRKVKSIMTEDAARLFLVPSAPGKRYDDDTKVTDMLYSCYETILSGGDAEAAFYPIALRYEDIIAGLGLSLSLQDEFDRIIMDLQKGAGMDYAASRGEYLNGIVLADYLGWQFVDAASVIFFLEDGSYDDGRTCGALRELLGDRDHVVIPGFYGSLPDGRVKTFSRGGSDITGSIVAKAIQADLYENWTDVSGFLVADPRIVKNPEVISMITYRELRELSYMGATVLHEDAIFPVRSAKIPINIRNTNNPEAEGTMIVAQADDGNSPNIITGIAGKRGFSGVAIEKDMMNSELGFGRKVLQIFEENGISFEHLPSGIDTMTVIVETADLEGKREILQEQIASALQPDHLEIEDGLAMLAVVGRGMRKMRGTAARVCAALAHANINIRMIDQGSSELNIIVGIDEGDLDKAINVIYDMFML